MPIFFFRIFTRRNFSEGGQHSAKQPVQIIWPLNSNAMPIHSALRTPHSAWQPVQIIWPINSNAMPIHSALRTPHSALRTPHSALLSQPPIRNPLIHPSINPLQIHQNRIFFRNRHEEFAVKIQELPVRYRHNHGIVAIGYFIH